MKIKWSCTKLIGGGKGWGFQKSEHMHTKRIVSELITTKHIFSNLSKQNLSSNKTYQNKTYQNKTYSNSKLNKITTHF